MTTSSEDTPKAMFTRQQFTGKTLYGRPPKRWTDQIHNDVEPPVLIFERLAKHQTK